jgi:proline iminopeptidase
MLALALLLAVSTVPPSACATTARDALPAVSPRGVIPGEHTFQANGVRLWYCITGNPASTAPIVFLHGGPGQGSFHFAALAGDAVEKHVQIVYFDQRGSGRSGKPADGSYSMSLLVDDVEALRKQLDVPRLILAGHSFGATLALEYAARYPENVAGIVFAAGLWSMPVQCAWRVRTLAELRPDAFARVRADTVDDKGQRRSDCELEFMAFRSGTEREAYNAQAMFPDSSVALRMDSVQKASGLRNTGELGGALFRGGLLQYEFKEFTRLTMPVLVIAGAHDGAARREGLQELVRRLPKADYREYERSGHFVYLDEPDRFGRDVAAFARSASGAAH